MKRKGFLVGLCLVIFTACQPGTVETNRSLTASSTPETVDTAAIEAELLRIENDWPRVLREKDVEAVRRVEADDIVLVYPDGKAGNKEMDLKDIEAGSLTFESAEMVDLKVKVLDKDTAIVTGRTILTKGKFQMPNGQSLDISGQYRFVDTFARRDGDWKLVAGASVPIREPEPVASPSPGASPAASPAARVSPTARSSPAASPGGVRAPAPPSTPMRIPSPSPAATQ